MHAKRAFAWSLRTIGALALILTATSFGQTVSRSDSAAPVSPGVKSDAKTDNSELLRIVTALEERVKDLETRLAAAEAANSVQSTKVGATTASAVAAMPASRGNAITPQVDTAELRKELEALKEEQKKNSGFLGFFRDVEVNWPGRQLLQLQLQST
jgi:hypothetical protein